MTTAISILIVVLVGVVVFFIWRSNTNKKVVPGAQPPMPPSPEPPTEQK